MAHPAAKVAVAVAVALMLGAPAVLAHGNLQRTLPKVNSVLKKVPNHVLLEFSQRPKKGARITVLDGCRRNSVRTLQLQRETAHIEIEPQAQPGRFKVSYRIVSAVDGDATRGSYGFRVRGTPDCSEDPASPDDTDDSVAQTSETNSNDQESESSSTSQVLLLGAVGTIALGGIALILRRGRSPA